MAGSSDVMILLLAIILGGTIVLGIFTMVLVLKSNLGDARWYLGMTLFALLMHLLTFLLFLTRLIHQWPHLLGTTYPFVFLTGPAFYIFIRSYLQPRFKLKSIDLIHLIPAILVVIGMWPTYSATEAQKLATIEYYYHLAPENGLTVFEWLYLNLYVVVILGYAIAALLFVQKHTEAPHNPLIKFCWLFLVLCVVYLVLQSGFILSGASLITSEIVLSSLMALAILVLSYWVLDIHPLLPTSQNATKYQTSPLSGQQAAQIQQSLIEAMEAGMYLNPRLKISDMAKHLKIPSHHLSQVLNSTMKTNFYQLVNEYRVRQSQKMLRSDRLQQVSIQGIGFDCGFSNKTSFYRAFKKATGMTPAEFAREQS